MGIKTVGLRFQLSWRLVLPALKTIHLNINRSQVTVGEAPHIV